MAHRCSIFEIVISNRDPPVMNPYGKPMNY